MRILFLSRWYPWPTDNGSKIRVAGLLKGLCEHHDVSLISFYDPAESPAAPACHPGPREIRCVPFRDFRPASARALGGYLSSTPRFLVDTFSADMSRAIRESIKSTAFDLVVASELWMAAYRDAYRDIPAIFDDLEIGLYRSLDESQTGWQRFRQEITWVKHRRYLGRLVERFQLSTVPSEIERKLVAKLVADPARIHVVPNSISSDGADGDVVVERAPGSLIFTGSLRYRPNLEAVTWFLSEIFPAVRARRPDAILTITGDPGDVRPAGDHVVLSGRVPDVRPLISRSAVSVAPLRTGGGTRLKILEAMALRAPVVATRKAAEGLELAHGEHLLMADTADEFTMAVLQLLEDESAAAAMADRAYALFSARYDSQVVVSSFLQLVDQVVVSNRPCKGFGRERRDVA